MVHTHRWTAESSTPPGGDGHGDSINSITGLKSTAVKYPSLHRCARLFQHTPAARATGKFSNPHHVTCWPGRSTVQPSPRFLGTRPRRQPHQPALSRSDRRVATGFQWVGTICDSRISESHTTNTILVSYKDFTLDNKKNKKIINYLLHIYLVCHT